LHVNISDLPEAIELQNTTTNSHILKKQLFSKIANTILGCCEWLPGCFHAFLGGF